MKTVILAALGLLVFYGCSDADTLGDEPPVEVVIQGLPTWENGMGELIALKCGYCHADPKPPIAPNNIVTDLDLNVYETTVKNGRVVRGADSLGRWIFEGILDHPVTIFLNTSSPRKMPLDYGTPVTDREKTFFEVWSNEGLPRNGNPDPNSGDPGAGSGLYFGNCVVCHDIGNGVRVENDIFVGPPIRPQAVTVAKVKSMWLHKIDSTPLSDEDAADIKAFLLTLVQP